MLLEEFLGVGFENLPRRVRDDNVEAAAAVQNFVELIAPVERLQGADIRQLDGAARWLAPFASFFVPNGLFILDAEVGELLQENFVEGWFGVLFEVTNAVAETPQIVSEGCGMTVVFDEAILLGEQIA